MFSNSDVDVYWYSQYSEMVPACTFSLLNYYGQTFKHGLSTLKWDVCLQRSSLMVSFKNLCLSVCGHFQQCPESALLDVLYTLLSQLANFEDHKEQGTWRHTEPNESRGAADNYHKWPPWRRTSSPAVAFSCLLCCLQCLLVIIVILVDTVNCRNIM